MSEYNNDFDFDFNAIDGSYDMPGFLNVEPAPTLDHSGNWKVALHPQPGLMEGSTAAQLHVPVDLAPSKCARSNGFHSTAVTCAICLSTFQTAFALDNHAKEATHQAYKCRCGTDFNKHSALQRHINTKDAPKTFACTLCSDKFTRKDKLKDHCRHYHKVTDDGLRFLFDSQQVKARPGAATRRRRTPAPLAAASSASAATLAPAPPALAPTSASAGPSLWSAPAYTGQQYASFSTGSFDPAADPFAAVAVPGEDFAAALDYVFGDETWTTGFDGFNS